VSTAIAILENPAESTRSDAEQLGAEITELCSYIYAAESRLLSLIHEFDEKEYWAQLGLCSCAHWLNFKCGIGMGAAREKVRVAHALAELPKISEEFARGALSYSKVRAMTRIADEKNEDYLLMIAEHGTAHHVEKLVSKYRTAKRLQDPEIAKEQYNNREVTHYYDHDGCLVIKARLPAEQGGIDRQGPGNGRWSGPCPRKYQHRRYRGNVRTHRRPPCRRSRRDRRNLHEQQ